MCELCQLNVRHSLASRCDLLPLEKQDNSYLTVPIYSCTLYDFDSDWVQIIKRYKYKFSRELDAFLAAQLYSILFSHHLALLKEPATAVFIPVPIAYLRKNWRGFNQSELLAKRLSKLTHIGVWHGIKRCKGTSAQAYLGGKQRRTNLENAFRVVEKLPTNVHTIIFVDDVVTTGSTLKAVINTMRQKDPNRNYMGICLASRLVFS